MGVSFIVCPFCGDIVCDDEIFYCEYIKYKDEIKDFEDNICSGCIEEKKYEFDEETQTLTINNNMFNLWYVRKEKTFFSGLN